MQIFSINLIINCLSISFVFSTENKNHVSKNVRPLKHDVTYKVFIIRGMMFPLVEFLCLLFRDCCHWSILDFPSSGALGILLEE